MLATHLDFHLTGPPCPLREHPHFQMLAGKRETLMPDRRTLILSGTALAAAHLAAPALGQVLAPPKLQPLDAAGLGSAETPLPGVTIAPELWPVLVRVKPEFAPGSIIVLSSKYFLYYITRKGHAIRYGVAVGKAELQFRGVAEVGAKTEWPSWKPTPEMVERNPKAYAKYAEKGMPGGPGNPLGARAIYLYQNGFDTAVRIHGTVEPNSIGRSVSNGCIRMLNEHVTDLYARVELGVPVTVF
jgi:lipoprotein-anchoring transpeptidase ErfK/SrfK